MSQPPTENMTFVLRVPVIFDDRDKGVSRAAIVDVNGTTRLIGTGLSKTTAMRDLQKKLTRYLNRIFH